MTHRSGQSSELTTADLVEILSSFEPRPTGHTVARLEAPNVMRLDGGVVLHPADDIWLEGLNSVNPVTLRDTGMEARMLVSRVLSQHPDGCTVEVTPGLYEAGQFQNVVRLPRAGDAVWALHREAEVTIQAYLEHTQERWR